MSNFCERCVYDPEDMTGENACPFNALYWDFLARNKDKLQHNHRLPYVYSTWEKFGAQKQKLIRAKAEQTMQHMRAGKL